MRKKLCVHGNNFALILTPKILKDLNITKETPLKLSIKKGVLTIEAVKETAKKLTTKNTSKNVLSAGQEVMKQYDEVFKRLAKT